MREIRGDTAMEVHNESRESEDVLARTRLRVRIHLSLSGDRGDLDQSLVASGRGRAGTGDEVHVEDSMSDIVCAPVEVIEVILFGKVIAKKNLYGIHPTTHKPFKNAKVLAELNQLIAQIDGYERNAFLEHPDIDLYFEAVHGAMDRDNALTTILDIFKEVSILVNDSIAQCNGKITIHPATWGEVWKTTIVLTPSRTFVNRKGHPQWCRCAWCGSAE